MAWCVDMEEFEAGWGHRLDETIVFDGDNAELIALDYASAYNRKYNTAASVPNWYIVASKPYQQDPAPTGSKVRLFEPPKV